MLLDLSSSILWSQTEGRKIVRQVLEKLQKQSRHLQPERYQRAWVLQNACQLLQKTAIKSTRTLTPSEQAMVDSIKEPTERLVQLESYFHRLHLNEQILLLLRDKYGIPYPEIAIAMHMPEDSLKVMRQQALETLERWVWCHA